MRRKGALVLAASLGLYGTGDSKDGAATKEACYALRSVTMGDDRRKDFSCKLPYTCTRRSPARCVPGVESFLSPALWVAARRQAARRGES